MLASDNPLRFRKIFLIYNKVMIIDDQIRNEKLKYNINRDAAKISALSSGKIDKYEYLAGQEILPSNQQQIIEQAKCTYSPLGKVFEKQIKANENQRQKQVEALKNLEPKEQTKALEGKSNNQSKAIEGKSNNQSKAIEGKSNNQ